IFRWDYPDNQLVTYDLLLVKADNPEDDPGSALNSPNDENIFLQITLENQTSYQFTGPPQAAKQLEPGTYFWMVTAHAPLMFVDEFTPALSPPFTFRYGQALEGELELESPIGGVTINSPTPTLEWTFPPAEGIRFDIEVYQDEWEVGEKFGEIEYTPMGGGNNDRWSYRYGTGFNERALEPGTYWWGGHATATINGQETSTESVTPAEFVYQPVPPNVQLLDPERNARIRDASQRFSWELTGAQANNPDVIIGFELVNRDENNTILSVNSDENRVLFQPPTGIPISIQPIIPLEIDNSYEWTVTATLGDASMDATGRFSYPIPQPPTVELLSPTGDIETSRPWFNWRLSGNEANNPDVVIEFLLTDPDNNELLSVRSDEDRNLFQPPTGIPTSLQPSQPLVMNSYIPSHWSVTAYLGFNQNDANGTFTYPYPDLILIQPGDRSPVVVPRPTFEWGWSRPLPDNTGITGYRLVIRPPNGMPVERRNIQGNVTRFEYPEDLVPGRYNWDVTAETRYGEVAFSEEGTFSYDPDEDPDLTLRLVTPEDNRSFESVPSFGWSFPFWPDEYTAEFTFIVTGDDVITRTLGSNIRSYTWDGDPFPPGEYSWDVDVTLVRNEYDDEHQQLMSEEGGWTFTIRPQELPPLQLTLTAPENEITVDNGNPTLSWAFPELPDGYSLGFSLSITGANDFSFPVDLDGALREYTYGGENIDPLLPGQYSWTVSAIVAAPDEDPEQFTPENSWTFTVPEAPPIDPNSPLGLLIAALRGKTAEELQSALIEAFGGGGALQNIRMNGQLIDMDELMVILQEEDIEIVLIGGGGQ
ncbi:MAG: hypothetical protein P9M15_05820, partial [Candidatus Electryoneaceae bacterium]|nr:hypothetical protein [Candidatus Electryoneaceae bacterium]